MDADETILEKDPEKIVKESESDSKKVNDSKPVKKRMGFRDYVSNAVTGIGEGLAKVQKFSERNRTTFERMSRASDGLLNDMSLFPNESLRNKQMKKDIKKAKKSSGKVVKPEVIKARDPVSGKVVHIHIH